MSNLTALEYIQENSQATPGLWNQRYSTISANLAALNSDVTLNLPSGETFSLYTNLDASGNVHAQRIGIGATPSAVTRGMMTIAVSSALSDYIHFEDTSAARSNYLLGSRVGGTSDGLNLYDLSGDTMIASFSKQSVRFYQNVVGPVFDVGGALADTYNAATFGTGAQSTESRIQAAISQASIDGVARVYVPANMYPYSAASVSFDSRVQMVREGGNWSHYDVKAYGAAGNATGNDGPAITAAISGVTMVSGGIVFFPAGEYRIRSTITMARGLTIPVLLVGEGMEATQIHASGGDLAAAAPVMSFDTLPTLTGSRNFSVRDMQISRSDVGRVFRYTMPSADANFERLTMAEFRNVYFRSGATGAHTNVDIEGALHCVFHQVRGDGGNIVLSLKSSSNLNLFACWLPREQERQTHGVVITNGGGIINFYGHRSEVVVGGSAISLSGGVREVNFFGLWFEGDETVDQLNLDACQQILIVDPDLATPAQADSTGIRIGSTASHIKIIGGRAKDIWAAQTNSAAIRVASGAKFITIDDMAITDNAISNVSIADAAGAEFWGRIYQGDPPTTPVYFGQSQSTTGTAIAPAFAFSSDKSLGWWRSAVSTMRLSYGTLVVPGNIAIAGSNKLTWQDDSAIIGTTNVDRIIIATAALYPNSNNAMDLGTDGPSRAWRRVMSVAGTAILPGFTTLSETSLGFYRSGVSMMALSYGQLSLFSGSNTTPGLGFSDLSLGFYKSGAATISQSSGTFNLATNAVRLSLRTLGASVDSTQIARDEFVVGVRTGTLAATQLAINSGGTIYYFESSSSTKG